MDSPWDEDAGPEANRDAEWTKLSIEFTNAGYREGITAGKESALQEGFDSGFASVGAPLGREMGLLRGMSSAFVSYLTIAKHLPDDNPTVLEARTIASQLSNVRFSDIAPPDLEAEAHAREHLETDGEDMDENEEVADKRKMEGLEDMLARLTPGTNAMPSQARPTMDDVHRLKYRLRVLSKAAGLGINWS
ncbi:hypothetical protein Moror_12967 [Moniliophthora roreri MCA 2997]|uniref:Protein YAE1 n=2 Tax=Moniliophthora roreri TaxID=221103 RepID=V2YQG7_MONRO|nr:hypothetical protein Moror_12967 [Moniliophthora roreri MCA 2997]